MPLPPPAAASVRCGTHSPFPRETSILPVAVNVCFHCGGRASLSDGDWKCVLLPLRMRNGGSGWVSMFVLAPAFSTSPALGNPEEKRVLFPAPCTAPLCSTSLAGESENETGTNTPLLATKHVLATGGFSQNRPGCVRARRWGAGREPQEPFRLQRCVLPLP